MSCFSSVGIPCHEGIGGRVVVVPGLVVGTSLVLSADVGSWRGLLGGDAESLEDMLAVLVRHAMAVDFLSLQQTLECCVQKTALYAVDSCLLLDSGRVCLLL